MSCGVDCRHGSNPALLWLWCRVEAAAPIQPLAWELPYATNIAIKSKKKKKKNDPEDKLEKEEECLAAYM